MQLVVRAAPLLRAARAQDAAGVRKAENSNAADLSDCGVQAVHWISEQSARHGWASVPTP